MGFRPGLEALYRVVKINKIAQVLGRRGIRLASVAGRRPMGQAFNGRAGAQAQRGQKDGREEKHPKCSKNLVHGTEIIDCKARPWADKGQSYVIFCLHDL